MPMNATKKTIKKMMVRTGDSIVYITPPISNQERYIQSGRIEGLGNGYNDSIIISGNEDHTVENSVCTLRNFNGKLIAKNSQVYVDSASGTINLETSSLDIIGPYKGQINSVNSYIKFDDFFSSFTGTVNAELASVYIGPSEKLTKDDTVIVKDPLATIIRTMSVREDIFTQDKILMADYRNLEGLPMLSLGNVEIFRIGDRYLMIELIRGKTTRVKAWQEVFVKTDDGITVVDSTGSLIYRKH